MSVDLNKKGLDLLCRINTNHTAHKWHRNTGEQLDRRHFVSASLCDQSGKRGHGRSPLDQRRPGDPYRPQAARTSGDLTVPT